MTDGAATLDGIELVHLRLPLAEPWITPLGRLQEREVTLVRAVVGGVDGWGECVAQPEPTYSPEYAAGAWHVLLHHLLPRLLVAAPVHGADVTTALAAVRGHPMAKAALQQAVLDAELRAAGLSLASWLHRGRSDGPPATVPAGVAVGLTGSVDDLVGEVGRRLAEGYRRVKIKIHPGWDRVAVGALRREYGGDVVFLGDANGSYAGRQDAATLLRPLDEFGLACIEQPLADDDLVGHADLARRVATPLCLDEAITSDQVAASALALGACGVINIKPGRVGGLLEAGRIHDRCQAVGVPVWCGGMLETGIGRAANLALASLPNFSVPGDLSAAGRFWAEDVVTCPARLNRDGTLDVPTGPGIGVEVRDDFSSLGRLVERVWRPTRS